MRQKSDEKLLTKILGRSKNYRYVDALKSELVGVLRHYRGLRPELDTFVFDNGEEKILLNLNGTIPVDYRGSTYNIPVCFWLLYDYPTSPPMAFVKPTRDMRIKVSPIVDASGRIKMSYLDNWRTPESHFLGLVQNCRVAFGETPPVFAKTRHVSVTSEPTRTSTEFQRSSSCTASVSAMVSDSGLTDEQLRESLLSAAEEVLRDKLSEEFSKTKAELESLHATSRELLDGQEKIVDIEKCLTEKKSQVEAFISELEAQEEELARTLDRLTAMENDISVLDVDSGVIATADVPVYRQLVDAYVEDSAIDDAVYALGEGLRVGCLSLETYLKKVRHLSRKQFFLRATMIKCREKAGLES